MNLENKTKTRLISELKKLKQENELLKKSRNVSEKIMKERKENEKRFKAFYENIPLAYQSLDVDGKLIEVNKAWCKSLGYKKDEIIGKNFSDFLTDDSKIEFKKEFEIFKKKGYMQDVEFKMMNKDGEVLIMSCNSKLGCNEDGTFKQTHTTLNNITVRKNMEEELRSLSLRQNAILTSVPDIIMEVDNNKIYTWANASGQEFFGNDVIGREASYYFEGEQKTYIVVEPIFKGDENTIYLESWQRRKDGEKRLLAWWCHVLKDKSGNATGALSTARDITEQKQVDIKLKDALYEAQSFREALDKVPSYIYMKDTQSRYIYANKQTLELFGCSAEELVGCDDTHFFPPDTVENLRKIDSRVFNGETTDEEIDVVDKKTGGRFYLEVKTPIFEEPGSKKIVGLLGISTDITERKQVEVALIHSHDLMRYIIEHNRSCVAVHDRDLKYIYVSQSYLHDYKVKEKNVIGKHHYDVFPDLPQKWRNVLQKALAGEILSAEDDVYEREDGTVDWTRWECRPWYEADDKKISCANEKSISTVTGIKRGGKSQDDLWSPGRFQPSTHCYTNGFVMA